MVRLVIGGYHVTPQVTAPDNAQTQFTLNGVERGGSALQTNPVATAMGAAILSKGLGGQLWVKLGSASAAPQNVSSADEAVDKGVLWALPATRGDTAGLNAYKAAHPHAKAAVNDNFVSCAARAA